jgi:GTP cyclohydrolase FolE2
VKTVCNYEVVRNDGGRIHASQLTIGVSVPAQNLSRQSTTIVVNLSFVVVDVDAETRRQRIAANNLQRFSGTRRAKLPMRFDCLIREEIFGKQRIGARIDYEIVVRKAWI